MQAGTAQQLHALHMGLDESRYPIKHPALTHIRRYILGGSNIPSKSCNAAIIEPCWQDKCYAFRPTPGNCESITGGDVREGVVARVGTWTYVQNLKCSSITAVHASERLTIPTLLGYCESMTCKLRGQSRVHHPKTDLQYMPDICSHQATLM